jgi:phosphoribosyl 1,2-cyclic phosphodiesterase
MGKVFSRRYELKIEIWGTRGSIPTPSTQSFLTSCYGGDTTCISVLSGDIRIIIDAGSGLRLLGLSLARRNVPLHAAFFFTHVHWDHIQGFPFFVPCFDQRNSFDLYGPPLTQAPGFVGGILEKALRGQQEDLNFPVKLSDMPARMTFQDLNLATPVVIEGPETKIIVTTKPLNHPGGCFGYRIEEHKTRGEPPSVFAFATDTEHIDKINPNVQTLACGADMLLYDAQYTPEEYEGIHGMARKGWGHSTWQWGVQEAVAAGARRLLLHHHDPLHDDSMIEKIELHAAAAGKAEGLYVQAARQGQIIEL